MITTILMSLNCDSNHQQLHQNAPGKRGGSRRSSLPSYGSFSQKQKTVPSTVNYCTPLHLLYCILYLIWNFGDVRWAKTVMCAPQHGHLHFMWGNGSCFMWIWFTLYFSRMYQWRWSRTTCVHHLPLNLPPVARPTTPRYNDAVSSNTGLLYNWAAAITPE